jgi:hypothetical protein
VLAVSAFCLPSYSYSDVTYGTTNNAAANGLSYGMDSILPDATPPWVTVQLNGMAYRYTMTKDPNADVQVHVRNEDTQGPGYIISETDDWGGQPGATIQKFIRFGYIDSTRVGDGEIAVDGPGTVTDPTVTYTYRMDVDDAMMKCSAGPLADPSCPGFQAALLNLLSSLDVSPDDPYYDEWVQAQLDIEADLEEDDVRKEDEKPDDEMEARLGGKNTVDAMVDTQQQEALLVALADERKIESYYQVEIQGGEYQETVSLEDNVLPDNRRALRSLASDANHYTMVRSQYDREKQEN